MARKRIAREAYARSRAAAEAATRCSLDTRTTATQRRVYTVAAAVVASTARAEMDTAPPARVVTASVRADDYYESARHGRLAGVSALEMPLVVDVVSVAEDALDTVVAPSWNPVSHSGLLASPRGPAAASQHLNYNNDITFVIALDRTCLRPFVDGMDL